MIFSDLFLRSVLWHFSMDGKNTKIVFSTTFLHNTKRSVFEVCRGARIKVCTLKKVIGTLVCDHLACNTICRDEATCYWCQRQVPPDRDCDLSNSVEWGHSVWVFTLRGFDMNGKTARSKLLLCGICGAWGSQCQPCPAQNLLTPYTYFWSWCAPALSLWSTDIYHHSNMLVSIIKPKTVTAITLLTWHLL